MDLLHITLLTLFFLPHFLPPTQTSPVVSFVLKEKFQPLKFQSRGLILTEKYVITAKLPLYELEIEEICAAPTIVTTPLHINQIKDRCVDIKEVRLANGTNICLVELKKEIIFTSYVTPLQIPRITSLKPTVEDPKTHAKETMNFAIECRLIFVDRLDTGGFASVKGLNGMEVSITAIDGEKLLLKADEEVLFCIEDSGLPLYCNQATVGMFAYKPEHVGTLAFDCERRSTAVGVNLLSEVAQKFLEEFLDPHHPG